jgi:hypothetical protein
VIEGLARGDVVAVVIAFADGMAERVTPNVDGGFVLDVSRSGASAPPVTLVALGDKESVLETLDLGRQ